jgi:hypothetical protein
MRRVHLNASSAPVCQANASLNQSNVTMVNCATAYRRHGAATRSSGTMPVASCHRRRNRVGEFCGSDPDASRQPLPSMRLLSYHDLKTCWARQRPSEWRFQSLSRAFRPLLTVAGRIKLGQSMESRVVGFGNQAGLRRRPSRVTPAALAAATWPTHKPVRRTA